MTVDFKKGLKATELGYLPIDWEVVKINDVAAVNVESLPNATDEEYELEYIDISSIETTGEVSSTTNYKFKDSPSRARRKVKKGDLILSTVRPNLKAFALINQNTENLICSTGFAVLQNRDNSTNQYLYQFALSRFFEDQVNTLTVGSNYPAINSTEVKQLKLPLPPLPEQRKIAEILTSVDETIESTRKVIEQTKKVKQGLLQELLTKGIGHTKFKKTEIGEIPEEWEVLKLEEVASIVDCKHRTPKYSSDGYPVVRPRDIKEEGVNLSECIKAPYEEILDLNENHKPVINDILYSRNATFGIGSIVKADELFAIGQDVCVISGVKLRGEFLFYLLNSPVVKKQLSLLSAGSTFKRINLKDIRKFKVPLISNEEQEKIISIFTSLEDTIGNESIKLVQLQRLKKGLMQDLLTGTVRVKV